MKRFLAFTLISLMLLIPLTVSVMAEDEVNYINSDTLLVIGENDYTLSNEYEYTVFSFEPTEAGKYTIAATDAKIGIISYNGMWATVDPSEETIYETQILWDCTSVGQSIWVAVYSENDTVKLNVLQGELVIVEIPKTEYENKCEIAPFTFDGDDDKLIFVDTEDDFADSAVLGDDGFYHLNKKTGPILYVDLDDSFMNLADAMSYGQVKGAIYENDEIVEIIDFNAAFGIYYENSDEATALYPLTDDLIYIYKMVGEYQGWYGEEGWIGGTEEDAWMFACYYDEDESFDEESKPEESKPEASTPEASKPEASTPETSENSKPAPGDGSSVAVWVLVMIAVCAVSIGVITARRPAKF